MNLFTSDWGSCVVNGVATLGCVWIVLQNLINALIALSGVVALFFIIWSGISMITSQGDQEKLASAKKTLTFAIIGLVFILLSFVLFNFILSTLGLSASSVGM